MIYQQKEKKTNTIPLYIFKDKKILAFPRLLFLEENSTFGQLKNKIYYFVRHLLIEPIKGRKEVDEEIKKYKE